MELNELIGIPYKFRRHNLKQCGCFGIVHLYYKHILHKNLPWTNGKIPILWFFRNRKNDVQRVIDAYMEHCGTKTIDDINDLRPGDVMVYKGLRDDVAVGVIVNHDKCLTTTKKMGTCLVTYKKLIRLFVKGIRIDETKI